MSPHLPTANLDSQVPSTKAWLLLLSLLTVLLLAGSRTQQPTHSAAPAVLVGNPPLSARPGAPLPGERRVALQSPAPPHQAKVQLALLGGQ